jgi:hypothetical protein
MLELDQILRANELSISLVAAVPALAFGVAVMGGFYRLLLRRRAPDPHGEAVPVRWGPGRPPGAGGGWEGAVCWACCPGRGCRRLGWSFRGLSGCPGCCAPPAGSRWCSWSARCSWRCGAALTARWRASSCTTWARWAVWVVVVGGCGVGVVVGVGVGGGCGVGCGVWGWVWVWGGGGCGWGWGAGWALPGRAAGQGCWGSGAQAAAGISGSTRTRPAGVLLTAALCRRRHRPCLPAGVPPRCGRVPPARRQLALQRVAAAAAGPAGAGAARACGAEAAGAPAHDGHLLALPALMHGGLARGRCRPVQAGAWGEGGCTCYGHVQACRGRVEGIRSAERLSTGMVMCPAMCKMRVGCPAERARCVRGAPRWHVVMAESNDMRLTQQAAPPK